MQGARDRETWIREMRSVGVGERGGYRAMGIARERLWELLEDRSVDPSAREGAALALATQLQIEERSRLGVVSQSTASPRLRVALESLGGHAMETHVRVALESNGVRDEDDLESDELEARTPSSPARRREH